MDFEVAHVGPSARGSAIIDLMDDPNAAARRILVGIIAVALLSAAALLEILPGPSTSQQTQLWRAACGRIGLVMVALWLAMPSRTRPAAWANLNPRSVAAVAIVALAIRFPQLRVLLPAVAVLFILGVFLRPKERVRPPRPGEIDPR
jgi:hypothetical protein